jgi:signal transduction histidine kinase/CheY-like chemotaxis protein
MASLNLIKNFRENFTARIFVVIALLIIIISVSFTVFFIRQQINFRKESLIREGELLARMLAHNGRLGVFAENENLLKDPIEGIMHNKDVLRVRVVNHDGKLLGNQLKLSGATFREVDGQNECPPPELVDFLKRARRQLYFKSAKTFEFWAPVLASSEYFTDETLLFPENSENRNYRIIGFVNVALDRKVLDRALRSLLLKSCIIAMLSLAVGLIVAYYVAKAISRPLNRLTERVNAMGAYASMKPLPVETNDEIGKLASAFNNMTESLQKKEAEKEVLEEQVRQAQKMEAVVTLAGGVAHDFNNLLTAIIGYGILLQNGLARRSALSTYIEQILSAAERAAGLVQRLLAFSRKQANHPKPLDLNQTVRNLHDILLRLIGENIELKINLGEDDLIVKADEGQMEQVIINLVSNAKDAMPDGGTIVISSHIVELRGREFKDSCDAKPGTYAALTVMDTGAGINPETRERMFDPFFTTKEVGKGTGLGLSIVYGIVHQHGGHISVDTHPGQMTSFTIMLPLPDSAIELKKLETLLLPRGKEETILLAEDDRAVRNLARHILTKYGYNVIEATDGEEAFEKFMENREVISVLLLDVIMPKMNGKQVYDAISRVRPDIKTLFISGYPYEVMSGQGVLEAGKPFISKPLPPGALLMKLREIIEN